ncbi:MAG: copper chaperone PCu(A)C [Pseudomonadota bacterium]
MRPLRTIAVLLLTLMCAACSETPEQGIKVNNGWIRLPVAEGKMTAGYITISNFSEAPVSITRVSSAAFERIEIHTMSMQDGMMRMRPVDSLTLAAGERIELSPNGLHLMLHGANPDVTEGQLVPLTLFDGEQPLAELRVPVAAENPHVQ